MRVSGGSPDHTGHYDIRYFNGVVTDEERVETLQHMIRAYLTTFRDNGLETWIAHGTLLGWWWNGKILPWDWDLDTQVSGATLDYLGEHMNQTRHTYTPKDGSAERQYLLDVNPHHTERTRGDGLNIIDARWIDTQNGLFIDITGLSETQPDLKPGVWSCKNDHEYKTRDLFPLRESTFEGVYALIPYSYDQILVTEYKHSALVNTEWLDHHWDPHLREWLSEDSPALHSQPRSEPEAPQPPPAKPGLGNLWRRF
ncbi:MAG: hypothetical protein M1839_009272 [Geoglossum umbratile]|nr:MAG: hypothetical protein M1839_009272 [Geoglossum umbratile]